MSNARVARLLLPLPASCAIRLSRGNRWPGAVSIKHSAPAPAPATQAWSANANKPPQGITSIAYQSRAYACTFADRAAGAAFPGTSAGVDGRT